MNVLGHLNVAPLAWALIPLLVFAAPASAQSAAPEEEAVTLHVHFWGTNRLAALDPQLEASLRRLESRSPTFASALDTLRSGRLEVVLLSVEQYRRATGRVLREPAHTSFVRGAEPGTISRAYVIVDVALLGATYEEAGRPEEWQEDLDVIVAHELYGHLVPMAQSALRRDLCRDPIPFPNARKNQTGCAVDRENRIRRELQLRERTAYSDLALHGHDLWERLRPVYREVSASKDTSSESAQSSEQMESEVAKPESPDTSTGLGAAGAPGTQSRD